MSIWSSITDNIEANAHLVDHGDPTDPPLAYYDVATATSWNSCIRLTVDDEYVTAAVMLTLDQARSLVGELTAAIARVEQSS